MCEVRRNVTATPVRRVEHVAIAVRQSGWASDQALMQAQAREDETFGVTCMCVQIYVYSGGSRFKRG